MAQVDLINVGRNVKDLRKSPDFPAISAVRMIVNENTEYVAGNTTGYTWEIESPWATQAQTNWLLTKMQGYTYQPYEADGGLLPPEAELGDYVNIRGVYGGLLDEEITFGKGYSANFSSPADEEIDHEYTYESHEERRLKQKVSKTSPAGNQEFGWSLQDDGWRVFNEDGDIFTVSATGAWLKGNFTIEGGSININNTFTVDEYGNLSATSGTFSGNVYAGNIQYGGNYGTFSGSGLTAYSVGYGKTGFTSTLDQVGTNKANIDTLFGYFTGSANFSSLSATSFWLNSYGIHAGSSIPIGGTSYRLVTWTTS